MKKTIAKEGREVVSKNISTR